jgi:hypothetical protein
MFTHPLLQDIADQLKEAQIKLGFAPGTVKLYYTCASLSALTGRCAETAEALSESLSADGALAASPLGPLGFTAHDGRVEVTISREGVRYVYEEVEASDFLCELIGLFAGHHHPAMDDVEALFRKQQSPFVRREMPEGAEFDCVLYFPDGQPDAYHYFFKEEMGHLSYHRFRPEDAAALLSE